MYRPWDWMKEEWSGDGAIGHLWIGREDVQWPSIFDIIRYKGPALSCSGRIFVYIMQPHSTPSFTCDVLERKLTRSPVAQDDIAKARPDIDIRTAEMVSKSRWMVPGYKVRDLPLFPPPPQLLSFRQLLMSTTGEIR